MELDDTAEIEAYSPYNELLKPENVIPELDDLSLEELTVDAHRVAMGLLETGDATQLHDALTIYRLSLQEHIRRSDVHREAQ